MAISDSVRLQVTNSFCTINEAALSLLVLVSGAIQWPHIRAV